MCNLRFAFVGLLSTACLSAHPMGNFSVSHYSRLDLEADAVHLTYVLDLAEIPTFELFQDWRIDGKNPAEVQRKAETQAREWLNNVSVSVDGKRLAPQLNHVCTTILDGAGGMQVARISMDVNLACKPGQLSFEDRNYANRTGWKEIVVRGAEDVSLTNSTHTSRELSHELTAYPTEPNTVPPQDLQASVVWAAVSPVAAKTTAAAKPGAVANAPADEMTVPAPIPTTAESGVAPAAQAAPSFASRQPAGMGAVVRGDFLSRMLHEKRFTQGAILIGILVAFGLGAMHALAPGHGKTIVAAYLVGSRGTLKHAMFLGFVVTFTHTISVFLLGLGVLFFQKYVAPDRIIPVLGAISGLSIVAIGSWLLFKHANALLSAEYQTSPAHHHPHGEPRVAAPIEVLDSNPHLYKPTTHTHEHSHTGGLVHTHSDGGSTHSHVIPESAVSLGSLVALGVSGGLVPCPSALILLLSAIALGHTALGLALLAAFSCGLALVLMGVGVLVLYAKHMLPKTQSLRQCGFFRLAPVFSAVIVIILGSLMTLTALGVIQPVRFLS
jgi:nickel/cobalt transporter (NicO) family protein